MAYDARTGLYLPRIDTKNYILSGMERGQELRKGALDMASTQQAQSNKAVLSELTPKIMSGDKGAIQQAYQLDPTGKSFEGALSQVGKQKDIQQEFLARSAYDILQAPPEMQAQLHDEMIRQGIQSGALPPEAESEIGQFGEDDIEEMKRLVRAGRGFEDVLSTEEQKRKDDLEQRRFDLDLRKQALAEKEMAGKLSQAEEKQNIANIEKESALIEAEAAANDSIKQIDELINHPGLSAAVGFGFQKTPWQDKDEKGEPIFRAGTEAANFKARFDQLKGQAFLESYQKLKGGGTITEVEGKKAESALTRMQLSQSEEEFLKAANEFKNIIQAGLERKKAQAKKEGVDIQSNNVDYKSKYGLE